MIEEDSEPVLRLAKSGLGVFAEFLLALKLPAEAFRG